MAPFRIRSTSEEMEEFCSEPRQQPIMLIMLDAGPELLIMRIVRTVQDWDPMGAFCVARGLPP